jgi:16S rRNA (guanine527-N7)-methyltransferase
VRTEEVLTAGARELGVVLAPAQIALFLEYLNNLKFWNKKINLTGTKNDEHIVINHFLDSMTILPFISEGSRLLDIGSGAGFPGIPLKVVMPTLLITLLDSAHKKVFFMRELIRKLKLNGVEAVCGRAEDVNNGIPRNHFHFVVSRAVGKIEDLAKLSTPYLDGSGKIILMRGPSGLREWEQLTDKNDLRLKLLHSKSLSLPFTGHHRVVLVIASTS